MKQVSAIFAGEGFARTKMAHELGQDVVRTGHGEWNWASRGLPPPYRRTHINTAAKLLLLTHAFEGIGANRVELNTDIRNLRSQRAIERIGATRDGVLRAHAVMRDGFIRDTVNYSLTLFEWPDVKNKLWGIARDLIIGLCPAKE